MDNEALLKEYYNKKTKELRDKVIVAYLPLVKLVSGNLAIYCSGILEAEDLYQYGVFGLIDAIDKFDITKDLKFSTYATFRIRGEIMDSIRDLDIVPRWTREKEKVLRRVTHQLKSENRYSEEELSKETGIPVEDLRRLIGNLERWNLVWFDAFEEGSDTSNFIPKSNYGIPESVVDDIGMEKLRERLQEALDSLTERERLIINLVYYEGMTGREVAEVLEVSESRVSQLVGYAIKKLKDKLLEYSYLLAI